MPTGWERLDSENSYWWLRKYLMIGLVVRDTITIWHRSTLHDRNLFRMIFNRISCCKCTVLVFISIKILKSFRMWLFVYHRGICIYDFSFDEIFIGQSQPWTNNGGQSYTCSENNAVNIMQWMECIEYNAVKGMQWIRAAPIPKFSPIPIPLLRNSPIPIPILPIPQIADTFADTDTDTFRYNYF